MSTARNQIVTRAFWRSTRQDWSLDIEETFVLEVSTYLMRHFRAETQLLLDFRTTQVNVTVAQTHILTHLLMLIKLERRCLSLVEDLHLFAKNLNRACTHVSICRAFWTRAN